MIRLIDQIANAEQDRHKVIHGMWEWDPESPLRLNAKSFRPRFEFEKAYDAERLHELANRIGRISFALEYPGGWDQAMKERFEEKNGEGNEVVFGSISRSMAQAMFPKPGPEDRKS